MNKNIISLSGGKDSTAMFLLMLEKNEPIHSVVFFDTGWEFPEMIEHVDKLEKYTGIEIVRLKYKYSFYYMLNEKPVKSNKNGKIRQGNGWSSMFRRWCTGRKLGELKKYLKQQKDFTCCIGFAADEVKRIPIKSKNKWPERYPLIEYDISEDEALQYCYGHGFDWGGLYKLFGRVSCYCCPLQRIGELKNLRKHKPELWAKMLEMDKPLIAQGRDFRSGKSVHDFEKRFAKEDEQMEMFDL